MRIAILTVSDGVASGSREDSSGPAIRDWVVKRGDSVAAEHVVPDDMGTIAGVIAGWADAGSADVVLTTGGNRVPALHQPVANRGAR